MNGIGGELSLEGPPVYAEALIVELGSRSYGIAAAHISRVLRMVEIVSLPDAPEVVAGIIDVGGEVVPVVDPRRKLGLPGHAARASDQIILADTETRRVGIWVDRALEFTRLAAGDVERVDPVWGGGAPVAGVSRTPEGLLVITDLDAFLSFEDEARLQSALDAQARR